MDKEKVFVPLDCLLDTRMGTLNQIDSEGALKIYQTDSYWGRETDDFSKIVSTITPQIFEEAYKKRDRETLVLSRPTAILTLLRQMSTEMSLNEITHPTGKPLCVEISLYPYVLNEAEKDAILSALRIHVGLLVDICFTNNRLANLSLERINQEYSALILYRLTDWLEHHGRDIADNGRAPQSTIYCARMFADPNNLPQKEDLVGTDGKTIDPYVITKAVFAEFIALEYLDSGLYSILKPTDLIEQRKQRAMNNVQDKL